MHTPCQADVVTNAVRMVTYQWLSPHPIIMVSSAGEKTVSLSAGTEKEEYVETGGRSSEALVYFSAAMIGSWASSSVGARADAVLRLILPSPLDPPIVL